MAAVCAVCLRPIVGKGFVIAETEVLHTACAPRAGETIGWRRKQEIARLRGELGSTTAQSASNLAAAARAAADAQRAQQERDVARSETTTARRALAVAIDLADSDKIIAARATAERDSARREAESLRREVALYRTLGPALSQTEDKPHDDRNPTDVRFSLLELDKP